VRHGGATQMLALVTATAEASASAVDVLSAFEAFVVSNGALRALRSARAWQVASDRSLAFAGHVVVEALLFATIVFLLLQRSYKPDKKPLTERVRARGRGRPAESGQGSG
jgi:hypothetical protein